MLKVINLERILSDQKSYSKLPGCKNSTIYDLHNGELLKILSNNVLRAFNSTGYTLEDRLIESYGLKANHLSLPTAMAERNGIVIGYTMLSRKGVGLNKYAGAPLEKLADIHAKLEKGILKNHKNSIVTPDLATPGNVIVTRDGQVIFLDYDGLQINGIPSLQHSLTIGSLKALEIFGYYDSDTSRFTEDTDILSATTLYLTNVFGIDFLSLVYDYKNPEACLNILFELINLDDQEIKDKIIRLFDPEAKKEPLGKNMYKIADNYLITESTDMPGLKALIRK